MDFALPEEVTMVRHTVARFIETELIPLDPLVLKRESERHLDSPALPRELDAALQAKAKEVGLWGIDLPTEYGGQDPSALTQSVIEQPRDSIVSFVPPPGSPSSGSTGSSKVPAKSTAGP